MRCRLQISCPGRHLDRAGRVLSYVAPVTFPMALPWLYYTYQAWASYGRICASCLEPWDAGNQHLQRERDLLSASKLGSTRHIVLHVGPGGTDVLPSLQESA